MKMLADTIGYALLFFMPVHFSDVPCNEMKLSDNLAGLET
jgi:hypothetical protein